MLTFNRVTCVGNTEGGCRSLPVGKTEPVAFDDPQDRQGIVDCLFLNATIVPVLQRFTQQISL